MAKVLVIDDEKQICEFLQKVLSRENHEVITALDGLEGLRIFHEFHPDVVITDIVMPKKDGFEVITELLDGNQNTAIIVITGGQRDVFSELSLESNVLLGVKGFLLKPFNFSQLLRVVQDAID